MAEKPPPFFKKKGSSSDPPAGGLRFTADPTLPPGQRRLVDGKGKKVAVVKKVGDKWVGSWGPEKFDSPQAALKSFASSKKS